MLAQSYIDEIFGKVVKAIRYKYTTIEKLSALLDRMKISNYCIENYKLVEYENQELYFLRQE